MDYPAPGVADRDAILEDWFRVRSRIRDAVHSVYHNGRGWEELVDAVWREFAPTDVVTALSAQGSSAADDAVPARCASCLEQMVYYRPGYGWITQPAPVPVPEFPPEPKPKRIRDRRKKTES